MCVLSGRFPVSQVMVLTVTTVSSLHGYHQDGLQKDHQHSVGVSLISYNVSSSSRAVRSRQFKQFILRQSTSMRRKQKKRCNRTSLPPRARALICTFVNCCARAEFEIVFLVGLEDSQKKNPHSNKRDLFELSSTVVCRSKLSMRSV